MSQYLQPDVKSLLEEVISFLSQLGDPTVSKSLRTKAETLKGKIQELCFGAIEEIPEEDEELYDEAFKEEDDPVPALPKARQEGTTSASGSPTVASIKGSVNRKSAAASWQCEEIPEIAASALTNASKQSYIEKKRPDNSKFAKMLSPYQKRYCVIQDGIFYYFETAAAKKQSGAFHIKEYEARPAYHLIKSVTKKEGSFEVVAPGQRGFQFLAKDFEEMKEWISAIDEWSDFKHPDVSTLTKPKDAVDKNSGMSSGSDSGSINASGGVDVTEDHDTDSTKRISPQKGRKPLPVPTPDQEIYDEAEVDQDTYDEAVVETRPPIPDMSEEIYDEAGIEEETYDEAGEAPPPVTVVPKIPPLGKRSVPKPPVPVEPVHRALPPPPPQGKTISVSSDDYDNMFYGLWNCQTSVSHELSFSSGDIIHIIDREHESSGWWTGLFNGKVGLVPKSFLTAAYVAS